jgi:murein L,D-transpeptidase YcbB/YkuD
MILGALLLVALLQRGEAADSVAEQIRVRMEAADAPLYESGALLGFYARRSFRAAWSGEHGPNRLADDLVDALGRADLEGLKPADYHVGPIRASLDSLRADAGSGRVITPRRLADLDLLLSDAFLLYGSHLLGGRVDPETLHPRWEANRRGADLGTVLQDALDSRKIARTLQRLVPTQDGYRRLREALVRERAIAAAGGWPPLPAGPELKRGDRGPSVAALRDRLLKEGDLRQDEDGDDSFDANVERAVQRFQERHGLDASGVVDSATRAELNVSAAVRAEQLRINLERWRWLPQDLGRRRIVVNIAAYELQVIEDDEVTLAMRVVVGRDFKRTPVFSDTVRYIVLNPYWHVPSSIAVEDVLPRIQRDPTYLERFGMHVFTPGPNAVEVDPRTIDWSTVTADDFPYRFHQEPGRLNALGRIKFMFPNRYDVYLHDTPSRSLFTKAQRDFSHGCIRVEKPMDLAAYLMKKSRWKRDEIERALDEGTERTIYLPRATPIHLLYWTAWANEDGTIQFRSDINGVDRPLATALATPLSAEDAKRN